MKNTLLHILILLSVSCYAQNTTISGTLKDQNGTPVSGAGIVLSKVESDETINYGISNEKGIYRISFSSEEKEIRLKIRSLGYVPVMKTIPNQTQTLNIQLQEKEISLEEVVVKSSNIIKKGDTLSYSVNAFSKEKDRTISDVLKHMPGIDVGENGTIYYQGKAINKYYIEGMDLLGGRYKLANENLPYKEVSKVQILENHQPIKALDSIQFSDRAALNIKLKNSYTVTGQAELGAGFAPLLWNANISPMLFSKKKQFIASYQSNNIGDDVSSQLRILTIEDIISDFGNNSQKKDWVGIQQLSTPNFSRKRWLNNNIHLLTFNYLHKLKKDYEVKLNASYLNDYQQETGAAKTQFYTYSDTISLVEEKYNQFYDSSLETELTLQKNTKKNYLRNSLKFQGFWNSQRGNIETNHSPLVQNLKDQYFNISNKLKSVFPLGKQMMTLYSYINLSKTPQTLSVNPGQFEGLLNNGNPYDEVWQDINFKDFYTGNSIEFIKGMGNFSFAPKLGFQLEKQNLTSEISTSENQILDKDFSNELQWIRSKFYLDLKTQFKTNNWRIELKTPVSFHTYDLKDEPLQKSQNLNRFTFEPRLSVTYEMTGFWKLHTSGAIRNRFGTISGIHYAYILQNYRSIQRVNTPLPQTLSKNVNGGISYRNPISSSFWTLDYGRSQSERNLMYSTKVLSNGATELQAVEQNNETLSHNFSSKFSKYFSKFRTNFTIGANYGISHSQQIINSKTTDIKNQNWEFSGKLDVDFTDWFNIELKSDIGFSKNQIQSKSTPTVGRQNHFANFHIYPADNQFISLKTEYVRSEFFSNSTNNFFADLIYRYTWSKKKIDFELEWSNIFNTKNYKTIHISSFSYIESDFKLRPSQVFVKVRFSL